jgi:ribosomal protein S18 acetylase RimI-like enzyme
LGVKLRQVRPVGLEYLQLVTDLLQRQRLADPFGGLYEAADMQWWYTRDPHLSDRDAVVWLSGDVPRVAAAFTRWSANRYNCVVLGDRSYAPAWAFVRARGAELGEASIEMEVDPADAVSAAEAVRAGFVASGETVDETWLDAADRARPRPVADGYVLVDRSRQSGPHPMIKRNGPEVEQRLRECSLYDPRLDLAVLAPEGEVAGYALFWPDPRTRVGMVEPMRVEQEHAGRGLAGALLREGLERLAERGCARLKVCHDVSNTTAARLYRGAGFAAHSRVSVYRRGAQAAVPG